MGETNLYIKKYLSENRWYKKEAKEVADRFEIDTTVDSEGVVRWNKNKRIPYTHVLEFWNFLKKPFNYEKTLEAIKSDCEKFYQEQIRPYLNRELSEKQRMDAYEWSAVAPTEMIGLYYATGKIFKL